MHKGCVFWGHAHSRPRIDIAIESQTSAKGHLRSSRGTAYGDLFTRALAFATATAVAALTGCAGYVPGRQSYWDEKVKEMCEKDGGVVIYEKVRIPRADFEKLGKVGAFAGIPRRSLSRSTDFLVADESTTVLRDANPRVWRSEQLVKRRSDEAIVAKVVQYSRVGGDFPSPSHSSSFACPNQNSLIAAQQDIFLVDESRK